MGAAVVERVDYAESLDCAERTDRSRRQRSTVAAAVVATLSVIVGPLVASALGAVARFAPVDDNTVLTPMGQRVLSSMPGNSYAVHGLVVVPAATDPHVVASSALPPDRVDGAVVDLGVSGLAEYGYLPASPTAPDWVSQLTPPDRVFSDVGELSFACTRWPGARTCSGSLLMEYDGQRHLFRSGLNLLDSAQQVRSFRALESGEVTQLVLGALPDTAASATVRLAGEGDGEDVPARTSRPGAVGGETLWWVSAPGSVAAVRFLDERGREVAEVRVPQ